MPKDATAVIVATVSSPKCALVVLMACPLWLAGHPTKFACDNLQLRLIETLGVLPSQNLACILLFCPCAGIGSCQDCAQIVFATAAKTKENPVSIAPTGTRNGLHTISELIMWVEQKAWMALSRIQIEKDNQNVGGREYMADTCALAVTQWRRQVISQVDGLQGWKGRA